MARKVEDTLRGVERLRAAIAIVGPARYSELRQELNFASNHLDDIPDREALRKAVETLEAEAVRKSASTANDATGSAQASTPKGAWRDAICVDQGSTARCRYQKNEGAEVVDRAAKGAFTCKKIKQLTPDHIAAMEAATDILRKVASEKIAPLMAQRREERRRLERNDFGQKASANMANKYATIPWRSMMRCTAVGPYAVSAVHATSKATAIYCLTPNL